VAKRADEHAAARSVGGELRYVRFKIGLHYRTYLTYWTFSNEVPCIP
jgi:hypothetical protein